MTDAGKSTATSPHQPDTRRKPTLSREDWNKRYRATDSLWGARPNRAFVAEAEALAPGRALDLGAGQGRNALWLAERGWNVRALDLSDVAIDRARQAANTLGLSDRFDAEAVDLRSHVPEARRYDLVAMIYFHIPSADLAPVLKQAAAAVAEGGTFLLVGHDLSNLTEGYGGPQSPDFLYTAQLVSDAIGAELKIERAERIARPVNTDAGERIAYDCLVRAHRR
ncbi:class I SAM-dependent methyltransferase [Nitratireductor aquibiodomus]|uniref:class I SAM-dependent methyltransferase n=1 Tax=Nitratireductor aquibiodomus TaxID=204799 RepID=UPI0004682D3E|nr:class I SAM-dependent methyltransferase [Nitratireductor aquibiodomus]